MSRRRTHMAPPRDNQHLSTGTPFGRSYEFYDGATKNSLRRFTIRIDYATREWFGTVAQRRKLAGNWKRRLATPEEIEQHRRMLSPDEIAHVTRACLAYQAPPRAFRQSLPVRNASFSIGGAKPIISISGSNP